MAPIKVVTPRKDEETGREVFDFRCPYPSGCDADGSPFRSLGWFREEDARERGKQHIQEHESGEAMPELSDFLKERGLVPETAGSPQIPPDWTF